MPTLATNQPRSVTLPSTGKTITIAPPTEVADVKGKTKSDKDKFWLILLLITAADIAQAEKFWRLYAPASFAGMLGHTNGFGFDEPTQQWTKKNSRQDDEESRAIYLAFLARATADIEKQAGRMARGRIPLDEWETSHMQAVKSLYVASDAFGRGGIDFVEPELKPDTPAVIHEVPPVDLPGALNDATARLKRFGVELESGDGGTVTAIIRRAGLYAGPAHSVMESARRDSHKEATDEQGKLIEWEELNVLGNADHCRTTKHTEGCEDITEAGWMPLGTMPLPGERTCSSACKCYVAYRVAEPNKLSDVREKDFQPFKALGLSATRTVYMSAGRSIVLALDASVATPEGEWRTINGAHVFIGNDGNFQQRLESPKKVKGYDDGTQTTGRIGTKGQKTAAMALGGRSYPRIGGGNGFDGIRGTAMHAGRDSFARSDRRSYGRVNPPLQLQQGNMMSRAIALSSGRILHIEARDPVGALALYNHNHDELGLFTDAETGSDHASSKAHAASAMAKKQNTKSSHRNAAAFHREAADRAEDAGNDRKAAKHTKMAEAHESAAKGISWK